MSYDISIIGGGPAGLAAGISLARAGFKTILFEKNKFPIDKPCGEGIMPPGVSILKQLGVLEKIPDWQARHFDGIHNKLPNGSEFEANFAEGPGLGLRRPLLSKALLEIASETSGLTIQEATSITADKAEGRWVIGADGLRSGVRKQLGLERHHRLPKRYGTIQHFALKPWNKKVEIHWARGVTAYITPLGEHEIGVAFLWDKQEHEAHEPNKHLFEGLLKSFPALKEILGGVQSIDRAHSIGPFEQRVSGVTRGNIALIGDAAGYIDPITGEGISLGLKSALLLTNCLSQGKELSWYEHEFHKSRQLYRVTTRSLLFLAKHQRLFSLSGAFLHRNPKIFQRLLSLNMGRIAF